MLLNMHPFYVYYLFYDDYKVDHCVFKNEERIMFFPPLISFLNFVRTRRKCVQFVSGGVVFILTLF